MVNLKQQHVSATMRIKALWLFFLLITLNIFCSKRQTIERLDSQITGEYQSYYKILTDCNSEKLFIEPLQLRFECGTTKLSCVFVSLEKWDKNYQILCDQSNQKVLTKFNIRHAFTNRIGITDDSSGQLNRIFIKI